MVRAAGSRRDATRCRRRLNGEAAKLGAAADYRAQLDKVGFEPFTGSQEQCAAFLKTEFERWGRVIRAAGVKAG